MKKACLSVDNQNEIDELLISLDGTDNKSKIGANAILGASMLFVKASSQEKVKFLEYLTVKCLFRACPFINALMKFLEV